MLLILPILLIMLILVILFFIKRTSMLTLKNVVLYIKNNWASIVPPIIKLWWNDRVKGSFVQDSLINKSTSASYKTA